MPKRPQPIQAARRAKKPRKSVANHLKEVDKRVANVLTEFAGQNTVESPTGYSAALHEGPMAELREKARLLEHILTVNATAEVFQKVEEIKKHPENIFLRVAKIKERIRDFLDSDDWTARREVACRILHLGRGIYKRLQQPCWRNLVANLEDFFGTLQSFSAVRWRTNKLTEKNAVIGVDSLGEVEELEKLFEEKAGIILDQSLRNILAEILANYPDD